MFTSVVLELQALKEGIIAENCISDIQNMLRVFVKESGCNLDNPFFQDDTLPKYTISNIYYGLPGEQLKKVVSGKNYKIRITFMEKELLLAFYETFFTWSSTGKIIELGNLIFQVGKIQLEKSEHLNDLVNNKLNKNIFHIKFISPVIFREQFYTNSFVDASNIIRNIGYKWNVLVPREFKFNENHLEKVIKSVSYNNFELNIKRVNVANEEFMGIIGNCDYEVKEDAEEEVLINLKCLLNFSRYCGLGYGTSMGMGQTQIYYGGN